MGGCIEAGRILTCIVEKALIALNRLRVERNKMFFSELRSK